MNGIFESSFVILTFLVVICCVLVYILLEICAIDDNLDNVVYEELWPAQGLTQGVGRGKKFAAAADRA